MSDTGDDAGSDDFDKEAEREKLREKYEADQQRREATEQMSDLLLKGATMTNVHCDECGSPIFRYEGEEFCPTCAGTRDVPDEGQQAGGQAGGQQAGDQAGADAGEAQRGAGAGAGRQDDDAGPQQGAGAADGRAHQGTPGARGRAASGADDDGGLDEQELEAARARLEERAGGRPSSAGGTDRRRDPPGGASPVRQGEVPSMAQTRASLRRAIVSLSEQAAQSDDPGRAHNLLKGAREASEALAALEGTTGE